VPREFLKVTIPQIKKFCHGLPVELLFNLDEVGIPEWEDSKASKMIILILMKNAPNTARHEQKSQTADNIPKRPFLCLSFCQPKAIRSFLMWSLTGFPGQIHLRARHILSAISRMIWGNSVIQIFSVIQLLIKPKQFTFFWPYPCIPPVYSEEFLHENQTKQMYHRQAADQMHEAIAPFNE
jgi:hypothetical protein